MPEPMLQWSGSPSIKGSSEPVRMILLTFNQIGLSFCWGLETTYCTPYLLSLGLSKSRISLVWIAGPLSGLLVQPIVGALADASTSRYGRRRPFMVGGAIAVTLCLLLLGWTKEVVSWFGGGEDFQKTATVFTAVLTLYVVDFAINVVQACGRSLIVDTLSISQQQAGSAWASRVGGLGSLFSYSIGTLDLVHLLPPWLGGDTQFKKMCMVSIIMLWIATGLTTYSVTERVLVSSPEQHRSLWSILPTIWHRTFNLPPRIQAICWPQFWASIGWFPFAFYSSTWVGETYYRYEHKPGLTKDKGDTLGNMGRLGSVALVLFSLVSFGSSVLFPYLIASPGSKREFSGRYTPRPARFLSRTAQNILLLASQFPQPDLVTAWMLAHLMFSFTMVWAPLIKSFTTATMVVAICGIPSCIGGWAPFSEIGVEINRLATGDPRQSTDKSGNALLVNGQYQAVLSDMDDDDIELSTNSGLRRRSSSNIPPAHLEPNNREGGSTGELAGVYLGVLNVYTTLPQFIGTFISWIVFSIFEPDASGTVKKSATKHRWLDMSGVNAISVCFLVGSISALVAAEATRRLRKMS